MEQRKRVLVVHREPSITQFLVALLCTTYECQSAVEEKEVGRLLRAGRTFDLLFLHVGALEEYRGLLKWVMNGLGKDVPAILVAARSPSQVDAQILRRGRFLQLPLAGHELLAVVDEVLPRQNKRT